MVRLTEYEQQMLDGAFGAFKQRALTKTRIQRKKHPVFSQKTGCLCVI